MANVFGTSAADTLKGGGGEDLIVGSSGNDYIYGFAGDDILRGDSGHDWISGDTGEDTITGGTGNDWIDGGDDDDTIVGLSGKDSIDGGAGDDTLDLSGVTPNASNFGILFDQKTDQVLNYGDNTWSDVTNVEEVIGTRGTDYFLHGATDMVFQGGQGNDTFIGGSGKATFLGGAPYASGETDSVSYQSSTRGVTAQLNSFNANGRGDAKNDTILFVENLSGSSYDDELTGDTADNVIRGGRGADIVNGYTGSDTLYGGQGHDVFVFEKSHTVTHFSSSQTYTDRGDDVIADYEDGIDRIEVHGFSNVRIVNSGADAILRLGYDVDVTVEDAAGDLTMADIDIFAV